MKFTTVLLLLAFSALAKSTPAASVAPAAITNDPPVPTAPRNDTTTSKTTTATTTTPTTTTTTTTTQSTTTQSTTTQSTTTQSTTTQSTTTASTTTASTTTQSTTTQSTTTPKTTPTTTTHSPTTTTTVPPTTTKPPGQTTSTVGNYTLESGAQRCVMVQMEVQIRLESAKKSFLLLPNKTSTGGECGDKHAKLILSVPQVIDLTMEFTTDNKQTYVSRLAFNLNYDFDGTSLGASKQYSADNTSAWFNATAGRSFSCTKQSLYMGNKLYLDINQDRMQAFNFSASNEFGTNEPCPADRPNYRVAIAVGITLLVLVVVVVVAYLLARRRRSDGYQSL